MAKKVDLLADATATEPTPAQLKSIGVYVDKALALQGEIAALEAQAKKCSDELFVVLNKDLPRVMDDAGCSQYIHKTSGRKVTVKEDLRASITKDKEVPAFAWLRENGHGELIKHEVKFTLDRGKDNVAGALIEGARREYGVDGSDKTLVHPGTLSAFCREQLGQGVELPMELLGIFIQRVATIK